MLSALEKGSLDALVIGPLTTDDFKQPIARFRSKGTKIVVLETPLPDGLDDVYLDYNQAEMAEAAIKAFVQMVQDGDEVAMVRANSLERVTVRERTLIARFKELRPKSTLNVDIMVGAQKGDDFDQCLRLLKVHPAIKAICTPFSACSVAMIKALEQKHLAGQIKHMGFGTALPPEAENAIAHGAMQAWVAQRPKFFGSKGVEAAVELASGKSLPAVIDVG